MADLKAVLTYNANDPNEQPFHYEVRAYSPSGVYVTVAAGRAATEERAIEWAQRLADDYRFMLGYGEKVVDL